MPDTTLLSITGIDIPPYSARGLQQTLELIQQAAVIRRTVNGEPKDMSAPQFRKYKSSISCTDQQAPAFDGLDPGTLVTVDCVIELSYKTAGGSPAKTVVTGSSRTDGDFTFYRPRLNMIVMSFTQNEDEYPADKQWQLDLEEV